MVEGSYQIEHVKKGRRLYGAYITMNDGRKAYLAYRRQGEIYMSGRGSLSRAMRDGVAAWAIDVETLREMRSRGVDVIGVRVRTNGDLYLTSIGNYYDVDRSGVINYSDKNGSLQRTLPLQYFRKREGAVKV